MQEIGIVTDLTIYSVKSFAGESTTEMVLGANGPTGDREFVVTQPDGMFITQRTRPRMSLLRWQRLGPTSARIISPDDALQFEFSDSDESEVRVWQDRIAAKSVSTLADEFLSQYLATNCRLMALAHPEARPKEKAGMGYQVNFPDAAPLLLTNERSLQAIQEKYDPRVSMLNFRPNIVVRLQEAFIEQHLQSLRIADVAFPVVYGCTRCKMINNDQQLGAFRHDLLQQMARDMKPVVFGLRMVHANQGSIQIGDRVYGAMQ